jgi:NAD(P)-dependent dehydrogenase (short-subunit alcohol dehydrogenase family)
MIASEKWLKKENVPSQKGRRILISGATSGIGFEAALVLTYLGAEVTIACRNKEKAEKTKEKILKEVPSASLSFVYYDQGIPESIGDLAGILMKTPFDAIVLNAGIYYPKKGLVGKDGTSLTFLTNAVGTYLLFKALYPAHPTSRYVFVNSVANKTPSHRDYARYLHAYFSNRNDQYAVSKRAVMNIFSLALSSGADATLTHPGITASSILREFTPWLKKAGNRFLYLFSHKPWKACLGIVYLASGEGQKGDYLVPQGLFHFSGYPKKARLPKKKCDDLAKELDLLLSESYGRNMPLTKSA